LKITGLYDDDIELDEAVYLLEKWKNDNSEIGKG
jgi:hypothetical protein